MELNGSGVTELDVREMRALSGGVRIWKPVGYTVTGEPVYEWVDVDEDV